MMRRFLLVCILGMAGIQPLAAQTDQAQPQILPNETIMRVKGDGIVRYKPEVLTISIGVATTAASADEALQNNNEKSAELINTIRASGIPASDVRTRDLNVEPVYSENDEVDEVIGWRAENTFSVRTERLEEAGEMIALLFEAGGNTLQGPDFDLTEETKLKATREAEAKALAEARDQAEATARVLGMKISRTLLVSDSRVNFNTGGTYIVVTGSRINRPKVPMEPGEIEVEATYSIEYSMLPN